MRRLITLVEGVLNELNGYKNDGDFADAKEIIGQGKHNRSALDKFAIFLKQRGFKDVQSGGFGIVFTRPDLPYMIKVFRGDPAYLKFVQFCQGRKDPHLPAFRGKVVLITRGVYAVRVERLTQLDSGLYGLAEKFEEFAHSHMSVEEFIDDASYYGNPQAAALLKANAGVLQTIEALKAHVSRDIRFDLHNGNFMMRGDTIVVSDPFYSESAYQAGSIPDDEEDY
jgi:hypothetical protein